MRRFAVPDTVTNERLLALVVSAGRTTIVPVSASVPTCATERAPPVAAVADYELIQATCDGVIVVVRTDHTDRTLCSQAFELIPEEKTVGVVLNCAYEWFLWKTHGSYYYYGSGGK